jgi:predicted transcriptional regulator
VGKGDVLIQDGELKKERLDELLEKTVREEIERSFILKQLEDAPKTVAEIAKATKIETDRVLWNILALMKWNHVEIKGEEKREYIYTIKEV